jgi:hypothetical protein
MDIGTMHLAFDLGLQRLGSNAFDNILPEEKDLYLNDTIQKYVEVQRDILWGPNSPAATKAGESLSTLTKLREYNLIRVEGRTYEYKTTPDKNYSTAPPVYLFITGEVRSDTRRWVATLSSELDYQQYLPSEAGAPIFRKFPVIQRGSEFRVVVSSDIKDTPRKMAVTYLKAPATVKLDHENAGAGSVNCDLPTHVHQQIVDMAVEIAWEDINRRDQK